MKSSKLRFGLIAAVGLALASCVRTPMPVVQPPDRDQISANLMSDIAVLASEEFGGRLPGTDGEILTVRFLIEAMRSAGLESGTNDPGNAWRAPVELISSQPRGSRLAIRTATREIELDPAETLAFTTLRRGLVEGGEMVFVGRESERVDPDLVRGNVVVMLGEPGVSPGRRSLLFEKQPAAIITVVESKTGIDAIREANQRDRLLLSSAATTNLSAFVTQESFANAIGAEAWSDLLEASESEEFAPVRMAETATVEANSLRRDFTSYNVIGRLPGRVPQSGAVLLLAHWDHLGECAPVTSEDRICNGAVDNASGLAVMLEVVRRLAAEGPHDRDIYVMATTAEEAGLLGARAFVEEPALPLDTIVAALNFDTSAVAPSGSSIGFIGEGRTSLDGVVGEVLEDLGRSLGSRVVAEQFLQRQDSWVLLQEGVPAVVISTTFGSQTILNSYLSERYHRPSDEIDGIELGGAIDDVILHEELIRRLADTTVYLSPGG